MRAFVAVKRVVDYSVKVRVNAAKTAIDIANVKHSMNPFCEIAVEEAVRLKEKKVVSEITAVTIGPKACSETLRTALAMGADNALHIESEARVDQELQPLAVAKLLAWVTKEKKPDFWLVGKQVRARLECPLPPPVGPLRPLSPTARPLPVSFFLNTVPGPLSSRQAIDDDSNQTGQMLAGLLGWPQATFSSKVEFPTAAGGAVTVTREVDGGLQKLSVPLPAVFTADLRLNEPRYPTLPNIMKAKKKTIEVVQAAATGVDVAPRLEVLAVAEPPARKGGRKVASLDDLLSELKGKGLAA